MIVVCVPFLKPHKKFLPHFIEWYAGNKLKHELELVWQMYRPLHKAQREGVKAAQRLGASHILFTEDDQWGFPLDGLDVLLKEDKDVIGFSTYMRSYPHLPMHMRKVDESIPLVDEQMRKNLKPVAVGDGPDVQAVDLITWAFTLVKVDVFKRLENDPFAQWGESPTDSYFSQYCDDVGIKRHTHFGYTIGHGDVAPEHVPFSRRMWESIHSAAGVFAEDAVTADARPEINDAKLHEREMEAMEADALANRPTDLPWMVEAA